MFNSINKFFQPDSFMPDSHEIAQRASAAVRFQDLSGLRFNGPVTYRDLASALLLSQRDLMYAVSKADKLAYSIKLFSILDAYIDAQKKISPIGANEIVITADNIKFAADFIIGNGSNAQKDELKRIYDKILDIAIRYRESETNIKNLITVMRTIR